MLPAPSASGRASSAPGPAGLPAARQGDEAGQCPRDEAIAELLQLQAEHAQQVLLLNKRIISACHGASPSEPSNVKPADGAAAQLPDALESPLALVAKQLDSLAVWYAEGGHSPRGESRVPSGASQAPQRASVVAPAERQRVEPKVPSACEANDVRPPAARRGGDELKTPLLQPVGDSSRGRWQRSASCTAFANDVHKAEEDHLMDTINLGPKDGDADPAEGASEEEMAYKRNSCCAALATHAGFKNVTLAVTLVTTVWLGIETNYNKAPILTDAPLIFQIVDNAICAWYAFEIVVRLGALEHLSTLCSCRTLALDLALVAVNVWETWVHPFLFVAFDTHVHFGGIMRDTLCLRALRALRLARLSRLGKALPDMAIFIEGMTKGVRAVATSLVLLLCVIYIFAIVFTQLLGTAPAGQGTFETVLTSMHFLFVSSLCGIDKLFIMKMLDAGWLYWSLWILFLLVANLTIMRMLTGVILNLVNDVNGKNFASNHKHEILKELADICAVLDADADNRISRQEFMHLLEKEDTMERLEMKGVDVGTFVEATIDTWKEPLRISFLAQLMAEFRGSKNVTFKDMLMWNKLQRRERKTQHSEVRDMFAKAFDKH